MYFVSLIWRASLVETQCLPMIVCRLAFGVSVFLLDTSAFLLLDNEIPIFYPISSFPFSSPVRIV